jgi:hypothetical protein
MKYFLIILICYYPLLTFGQKKTNANFDIEGDHFRLTLSIDTSALKGGNSNLILSRNGKRILTDSIFCSTVGIKFRDMNNDGIKDLLIFQSSGARANDTYNCFLYRKTTKDFVKVIGFEKWANLRATEIPGILVSEELTGIRYFYFLKLSRAGKLIDLKITEKDNDLDDSAYTNGIKKVRELSK